MKQNIVLLSLFFFLYIGNTVAQSTSAIAKTQSMNKVIIEYTLSGCKKRQNIVITPYYKLGGQLFKMHAVTGDVGTGFFTDGQKRMVWDIFKDLPDIDQIPEIEVQVRNHLWYIAYSPAWGDPIFYNKQICGGGIKNTFSPPLGIQFATLSRNIGGYLSLRFNPAEYPSQPDYFYHRYYKSMTVGTTLQVIRNTYLYTGFGYGESINKRQSKAIENLILYKTNKSVSWDFGLIWTRQHLGRFKVPMNLNCGTSLVGNRLRFTLGVGTHF